MSRLIVCFMMVLMSGCAPRGESNGTQSKEQAVTEQQQQAHLKTSPAPQLTSSQERKNLIERLNRFNTDSKVSYIYLVSYGRVMAFYTVKGKVSSVNSLLTTPEQIVDHVHSRRMAEGRFSAHVVASPDLDGSYGTNGDAIFFFCTDGTYVEWAGQYMLCDKPLKLSTAPELILEVSE